MSNTDRDSMLERWADGMEKLEQYYEDKYGPPATPPSLPPITTYDAMLEAIADGMERAKRNINKKSTTYHSDSVAYVKTVPSGDVHYASLEQIGGKTVVWNQMRTDTNNTKTADGITTTYDAETGLVSITNNSRTTNFSSGSNQVGIGSCGANDHKILVATDTTETGLSILKNGTAWSNSIANGVLFTNTNSAGNLVLRVLNTYDFVNDHPINDTYSFHVNIFDLTLMFGSGNEPTLAQCQQMFPAQYYPYNAGTLLSAGVDNVVSKGKNLLDTQRTVEVSLGWTSASTQRNLAENQVWKGFNYSAGTYSDKVNSYSIGEGTVTVNSSASGYGIGFPLKVKPSTTYQFSCTKTSTTGMSWQFFDKDGYKISFSTNNSGDTYSVTTPANCVWIMLTFSPHASTLNTNVTFSNIQFEESATQTTYSAYKENTYPIPASIQSLEGYGWSAGSVYNYIDFENKKFVQNVGRVDMGTINWAYNESRVAFNASVDEFEIGSLDLLSPVYLAGNDTISSASTVTSKADMTMWHGRSNSQVYIKDARYTVATTFISAVSGIYIYGKLATPVEVDISAYLTDDNLIEVEAGGTLTFPNANGDDYRIPVPSSETFIVGEP